MFRKVSFVFSLIFLTSFLVLPQFCSANDFEDITPEEIKKHLELPTGEVEKLLYSLIKVFHEEWVNLESSPYSSAEERVVPVIMRSVTRVQALNHLLIDGPIEIIGQIIKNAVEIARLFLTDDASVLLEKLEKESINRAIEYGMNVLLQNEIRITPGAINFKYISQDKNQREVIFQYIIIYQPIDNKSGKILIRFYSPYPLEPPRNEGSYGGTEGMYNELDHNLPPFIVEIQGKVENYEWTSKPTMKISFLERVPDLGIKPLSFWEKQIWKPIESSIKEVEIIITKVTGQSPKLVDNIIKLPQTAINIWDGIKSIISQFNPFGAGISQTLFPLPLSNEQILHENTQSSTNQITDRQTPTSEFEEKLDDIIEEVDVVNPEANKLTEEKGDETLEAQEKEIEETKESEITQTTIPRFCEKAIGISSARNKVIFNEIAWMGSLNSSNDEWIELKNISNQEIDLSNWQILNKSENIKFIFPKDVRLLSGKFLLLERTNDESVPGVKADLIYTGALNNNNETLYLFDGNCQLQDKAEANSNWPAGDNSSKRTMERKSDLAWQMSLNSGGTPKRENSSGYIVVDMGSGGAPPPQTPPPIYPQVLISEIQILPAEQRFIELYNPNDENLNLNGWYIQRKTETGTLWNSLVSSTHFQGKIINSRSHLLVSDSVAADVVLELTLTENNSLVLKNPNREIVDKVGWGQAQDFETSPTVNPEIDKSIGRKWSTATENYIDTDNNQNDFELQNPTPKLKNQSQESEPEPEPQPQQEEPILAVVINEIAWMGTKANSSDEWIELYNDSSTTINLNDWTLNWSHGTTTQIITFPASTISSHNFYLIERTDDNTVSDIQADLIYIGAFGNDGEKLELRDATNRLIDMVDCSLGWFAGDSAPDYISMERINPSSAGTSVENWVNNNLIERNGLDTDGNLINGTPKRENSAYQSLPPNPVDDLTLDHQNSFYNGAALMWSMSSDPDTPAENLSYKIYYSREGMISEEILNATSTFSTTTSATAITIPDLYYDSTYYFGVKVFDGQNYSALSNIASFSIPSALIDSSWAMFGGNLQRNNQSQKTGPNTIPAIAWIYNEGINPQNPDRNPLYTFPIIRPEGTIFSSVIYPVSGRGVISLNFEGGRKYFENKNIEAPLALQADGQVSPDDKKTRDKDGNVYMSEGGILRKIDTNGNVGWQREFQFENPYSCSTSTPEAMSSIIGENGIIYLVVKNSSCNSNKDKVDYLYLLSAGNEILKAVNLSGYRSSLTSVSSSGTAYVFYLLYGNWPPRLYLAAVSDTGEFSWRNQVISNYSVYPPSPVLIDGQENLYFVVGKDVFTWDKDRNEIWKVYLGENVPANWYSGDIGIVLGKDATLYLSGRGVILSLK